MNNKSNILLVDDDPGITNYLNTILNMNGFEMLHAKNSSDAYMMITSYCPDLILLELNLSDTDGVKIIKSVR
ncbi:MAG: response regulator, partial [Eubacteriales bacterium]|nr:response regulator [Eubacteriales bacterium]